MARKNLTKEQKLQQLTLESDRSLVQLRGHGNGKSIVLCNCINFLLQRKSTQYQVDIMFKYNNKFRDLYGGEMFINNL